MFISTMTKSIKLITRYEKLVLQINLNLFYNANQGAQWLSPKQMNFL